MGRAPRPGGTRGEGRPLRDRRDPRDRGRAGSREESPDKNGALRTIAEQPFGKALLALLALGLAGYASWQLALAILDRDGYGEGAKGLAKRAAALARGGWYGVLCGLTISTLAGNGSGNGNEQQKTAGVFDHPGGRYLVYAAGLAFLGGAAFNAYRADHLQVQQEAEAGRDERDGGGCRHRESASSGTSHARSSSA